MRRLGRHLAAGMARRPRAEIWGAQQRLVVMGLAQCCGYLFSLLLALLSALLLVGLVLHFRSHLRTLVYVEGRCTVVRSVYTVQYSCGCARSGCRAFYPCLLVYVLINSSVTHGLDAETREQLKWPVLVYDDDWQQIQVYTSDETSLERCTKYVCEGGTATNRDVIERYRLSMAARGQHHQCWFDPSNLLHKGAVFRRRITWTFSFHVLFWPVLFLMAGFCVFLLLCCLERRRRASTSLTGHSDNMSASETVIVKLEKY